MKSPKSLSELISKNNVANKLSLYRQQSQQFSEVQQLLSEIIGDNIAQNLIVSNYKNSILYIETTSAAYATHFKRFHSQVLSACRRNFDAGIVTIEVKVSPKSTRVKTFEPVVKNQHKVKQVPNQAADIFKKMAENSSDELKQKLLKLTEKK